MLQWANAFAYNYSLTTWVWYGSRMQHRLVKCCMLKHSSSTPNILFHAWKFKFCIPDYDTTFWYNAWNALNLEIQILFPINLKNNKWGYRRRWLEFFPQRIDATWRSYHLVSLLTSSCVLTNATNISTTISVFVITYNQIWKSSY